MSVDQEARVSPSLVSQLCLLSRFMLSILLCFSPVSHRVHWSCSQRWHEQTRPTRRMAEGSSNPEEREADDGTLERGGLALPSSSDVTWSSGRNLRFHHKLKKKFRARTPGRSEE